MNLFDVYYFWNVFVPWCLAKRDVTMRKLANAVRPQCDDETSSAPSD